jgi:hypothetical protein
MCERCNQSLPNPRLKEADPEQYSTLYTQYLTVVALCHPELTRAAALTRRHQRTGCFNEQSRSYGHLYNETD